MHGTNLEFGDKGMETVLIVEDSRVMQRTLRRLFESDGLQVRLASDGVAGLESFKKDTPSVVVLDLKLPRLPGKEVCRALKAYAASVPIVVLSANTEVEDKVLLLELGADDYVTKPFRPRELLARVRAAIRRSGRTEPGDVFIFNGISVNFTKMEVIREGQAVEFTAREFNTLKLLVQNDERVISRDELLSELWCYQNDPSTRTVDNHILKIRQKLED